MTARPEVPSPPMKAIPPLEPGDHLTRDEFERRYDATPGLKRAELIEGVVFMAPALRWDFHARPDAHLIAWLTYYEAATLGVQAGSNPSVRLDLDNEPQPDAVLVVAPAHGGRVKVSDDNYIEGAPELVAEVSASTVSIDLNTKFRVYHRNGVLEYLVWRVRERAIDWFVLRQGKYERLPVDPDGVVRSSVFPGLWLHVPALLSGDMAQVLRVLDQGVRSKEHANFLAELRTRGGGK